MTTKKQYSIGISCIGSGVGQSVINSCRLSRLPLRTVGLGTNAFAYGAYECDEFDYTPTIYAPNFVDELIEKCHKHHIDLIIPGRDDEAHIYAQNGKKFKQAGIAYLAASEEFIALCRDKERMSLELNPIVDVFVHSYYKESLNEDIAAGRAEYPLIAKPRGGFASMGIEIIRSAEDLIKVTDDHILQELAVPLPSDPNYAFFVNQINKNQNPQVAEISVQIVLGKEGKLIGKMASYNKLNNGVPIEIVPYDHEEIWRVVDLLLPVFKSKGFIGPLNIQGRITKNGFKVFEMNPRFTGITGLRALMGFNEVEACIADWLAIYDPKPIAINADRFGIRQTADKSISLTRNDEVRNFAKAVNGKDLKDQRTVLVTGASGYLGRCLVKYLIKDGRFQVLTIGRSKDVLSRVYADEQAVYVYDYADFDNGQLNLGNVDIVVHSAFARPHCTNSEIAASLAFTSNLFHRLAINQIPSIINISSQSVYGQDEEPLWDENTAVSPRIPYAQAKFATELMVESISKAYPHIKTTSLRLAALSGGESGLVPVDFLSKLVSNALNGKDIDIVGGDQQLEVMDVRDAAKFIYGLIALDDGLWRPVYNIGGGGIFNICEIAESVIRLVEEQTGRRVAIKLNKQDIKMKFGMDNQLILNTLNTRPTYTLADTIISLIKYLSIKQA